MSLKDFKKKNVDKTVSARIHMDDFKTLKAHGVNVSSLIRRAIKDAVKQLK